jgi:putative serine protease PepD
MTGGAIVAAAAVLVISSGLVPVGRDSQGSPVAAITSGKTEGDDNWVNGIYRERAGGVGFISAELSNQGPSGSSPFGGQGGATGSGFVIDEEGLMVTNNHVVEGATSISVKLAEEEYEATLVGADPSTDLALLKVDAPSEVLDPLPIGDSAAVQVGDPVVAIGNPFGLERTVTTGIVSALQRNITSTNNYSISDVIQTDAAINPGNSGGPLMNRDGEVIGVNSQIATGGGSNGNVGIGFAVPANTVSDVVSQLIESGEVRHAWLGVSALDLDPELAADLGIGGGASGILVQSVIPDGPADRAGIRAGERDGDLIVAIGDVVEPTMEDLTALVNDLDPGDELPVTVIRDGRELDLQLVLGERP